MRLPMSMFYDDTDKDDGCTENDCTNYSWFYCRRPTPTWLKSAVVSTVCFSQYRSHYSSSTNSFFSTRIFHRAADVTSGNVHHTFNDIVHTAQQDYLRMSQRSTLEISFSTANAARRTYAPFSDLLTTALSSSFVHRGQ
jgi:hypothetical protein